MEKRFAWLTRNAGKKLKALHSWNAWIVVLLAITGILLFIPSVRIHFSAARVGVKQLHIILGVVSAMIVLLYLPFLRRHAKQLKKKPGQKWNLTLVLFLLIGWILTGVILWLFRHFPPEWSNAALIGHDLFTWIGIPYAVYHSITRMRWVKRADFVPSVLQKQQQNEHGDDTALAHRSLDEKQQILQAQQSPGFDRMMSRRTFLRLMIGSGIALVSAPFFYQWVKSVFSQNNTAVEELLVKDVNKMVPAPVPHADSLKPLGGGMRGEFRVYTVTKMPVLTSDNWNFSVKGLVSKPLSYNWEQFLDIPRTVQVSDFHCVTGWSVYSVTYEGIPLSRMLDMAKVSDKAKFVKFYSGDGVYTDTLTIEQARMDDVMVAVLMDGKPIIQRYGGPVRLIVPQMYAYKSVKWLQSIELIEEEHTGFWEERGYDKDAWVQKT